MKITKQGRVTIPKAIRDKAGFLPNTEVEFEMVGDTVRLRKVAQAGHRRRLIQLMRGRGTVKMSTDEIMALTRRSTNDK